MSGLDAYRVQLVDAGARLHRPRRRRWNRRVLVVALAAIAVGAPALAATHPWRPLLGDPRYGDGPKPTSTPPPRSQLDALGVLRRDQNAQDRAAVSEYALRFFGKSAVAINTDYVRVLGSKQAGTLAVLVPAQRWDPAGDSGPSPAAIGDPLCVFVPSPNGDGGGKACFTLAQVTAGDARGGLGRNDWGLVPDGVAGVRANYADGRVVTVPVVDNYYSLPQRAESRDVSWIAEDGRVVRTIGETAPSMNAPRRYRYGGRWISPSEAARRSLACADPDGICADSTRALERQLDKARR